MTPTSLGKGAATAVALLLLSACASVGTGNTGTMGNNAMIGDNFVGASSCTNLSPQGNAANMTNRDDVRCGPQSVSPTL